MKGADAVWKFPPAVVTDALLRDVWPDPSSLHGRSMSAFSFQIDGIVPNTTPDLLFRAARDDRPAELVKMVRELRARVDALEKGAREAVIVLRELSPAEARTEVLVYFKSHPEAYPSDAAMALHLDSAMVRDIVGELMDEGQLA